MQKQIKKFFGVILALGLVLPNLVFGAGEFELLTRVKNVTAGDNPDGAVYTMAQAGDELRNLVIITNKENYERDYTVSFDFPNHLIYRQDSLEKYQGAWQKLDDTTENISLHMLPNESVFLRLTTDVQTQLPNENLILGMGVKVNNDQNVLLDSLTKVYIPNFNIEQDIDLEEDVSEEVKDEIKQIYQEEKEEIEHAFDKEEMAEELDIPDEEAINSILQNTETVDIDFSNLYIGAIIASLLLVYLIIAYVRKK